VAGLAGLAAFFRRTARLLIPVGTIGERFCYAFSNRYDRTGTFGSNSIVFPIPGAGTLKSGLTGD
jgi:hypothetical protein